MGEILVELPNETLRFEFAGEQPTVEERFKIGEMIREKRRSQSRQASRTSVQEDPQVDTRSWRS